MKPYRIKLLVINIALLMVLISSCSDFVKMPSESVYEEKLVINGIIYTGFPVEDIRVNRTSDITEPYDPVSSAVSGAVVILSHEGIMDTLTENDSIPGSYYDADRSTVVESGGVYSLYVSDGVHDPVSATTVVPFPIIFDQFFDSEDNPISILPDTITYIPADENAEFLHPKLFSFSVSQTGTEPVPALLRIINISLDASEETMIREDDTLKALIFKWNGLSTKDEDLQRRILLKASQSFNSVDFSSIYDMSWIYYGFYGRQVLYLLSMDQAYYDYHKGNLEGPPRDFHYLPETNVIGGYGLFCSAAVSPMSYKLYFLKKPE